MTTQIYVYTNINGKSNIIQYALLDEDHNFQIEDLVPSFVEDITNKSVYGIMYFNEEVHNLYDVLNDIMVNGNLDKILSYKDFVEDWTGGEFTCDKNGRLIENDVIEKDKDEDEVN